MSDDTPMTAREIIYDGRRLCDLDRDELETACVDLSNRAAALVKAYRDEEDRTDTLITKALPLAVVCVCLALFAAVTAGVAVGSPGPDTWTLVVSAGAVAAAAAGWARAKRMMGR